MTEHNHPVPVFGCPDCIRQRGPLRRADSPWAEVQDSALYLREALVGLEAVVYHVARSARRPKWEQEALEVGVMAMDDYLDTLEAITPNG